MTFQGYEDEIQHAGQKISPDEIHYAQKSVTGSFPTDDRRGSNNGEQQLVKQPLRGKADIPLMISGFCILAGSVSLWVGMFFFTGDTPVAVFFSSMGLLLGLPLLFLGAALLLIGLALWLKPAYSTVYGLCVSGAITLLLGLESLVLLIPETLRLVFHVSEPLELHWLVLPLLIFGVAMVLIGLTLTLKPGHFWAYGFGISGEVMLAFSIIAWLTTLSLYNPGGDTVLTWMLVLFGFSCAFIFVVVGAVLLFSSLLVFLRNWW